MKGKKKRESVRLKKGKMTFSVFNYVVHFVETEDFDAAKAIYKLEGGNSSNDAEAITWIANSGKESYIFVAPKTKIGTIVHECWHAINHMLTEHGVCLTDDEAVAYHLDHLVSHAMKFYGKEK